MIEADLKLLIESIVDVKAYPVVIPQHEKNTCIAYRKTGHYRNIDSNIIESNIIDYNFQLSVIGSDITEVIKIGSDLEVSLEGEGGEVGNTHILIIHVTGVVDIFDTIQHNYERAIDIMVKVRR